MEGRWPTVSRGQVSLSVSNDTLLAFIVIAIQLSETQAYNCAHLQGRMLGTANGCLLVAAVGPCANETTLKIRRRTGSSNALTVQFSWIECYKSRQRPNVALDAAGVRFGAPFETFSAFSLNLPAAAELALPTSTRVVVSLI
ncbi:hypothetical protein T11_13479 [Trichinella zimbabwensis]|uniref:Uncharacterized protein n=1 Tax=Trichinella zimbabwensis TaxID=268475 RepID=A0A0V1I1A3_9BILA|nr:hypothetical protein T11_13479 [Trichinella zimbabwensis]